MGNGNSLTIKKWLWLVCVTNQSHLEKTMKKSVVAIVKGKKNPDKKEIDRMVRKAIQLIGGIKDLVQKDDLILIKPNVCSISPPVEASNTDPRICRILADMVKELGGNPVIAEASTVGVDTEEAFRLSGYHELRREGYEVIDLKKTEAVKVRVDKGKALKKVSIYRLALDAKIIVSVPIMKTHDLEPATLSLKNMKGLLPDLEKRKFHTTYGVMQAVADLNTLVSPKLAVVDGIIAGQGMGSPYREALELDLVIAGKDPVAVDTVSARVMWIDPKTIRHLRLAEDHGLGTMDPKLIRILGNKVTDVRHKFKTVEEVIQEDVNLSRFHLIYEDDACTGCRSVVYYWLKTMKEQGKLDSLKGMTIVMGKKGFIPLEIEKERLLLVGVCTKDIKERGRYVEGCPPYSFHLSREVLKTEVEPPWIKPKESQ